MGIRTDRGIVRPDRSLARVAMEDKGCEVPHDFVVNVVYGKLMPNL